jgi:hypothetical protein
VPKIVLLAIGSTEDRLSLELHVQIHYGVNWGAMTLGKVYLNVSRDGLWSIGTYPYTVGVPPFISIYSPLSGSDGTVITIKGTDFGQSQNGGHVLLISATWQYTPLTVTCWSDTQISTQLPELTPLGLNYIYVNARGLDCICTKPLQVTTPSH